MSVYIQTGRTTTTDKYKPDFFIIVLLGHITTGADNVTISLRHLKMFFIRTDKMTNESRAFNMQCPVILYKTVYDGERECGHAYLKSNYFACVAIGIETCPF